MRVIAGALKGRLLRSPAWEGLRPTSDRLRETLFNILAGRVDGGRFLDVCAGTGAVGIEALSRGAAWVTFVEGVFHAREQEGLRELPASGARITGRAWITGTAQYMLDPTDPFPAGFLL